MLQTLREELGGIAEETTGWMTVAVTAANELR